MVGVVDVVVVLCDVLVIEKGLGKCCGGFEMESLVFKHCSVLKMGITLLILRIKLWGLLFWKACVMPYHFRVLSFRI